MKKAIFILTLTIIFSLLSNAQERSVTISMNNNVLHCPHLGVKFNTIFSSKKYVKDLNVNHETSVAVFNISNSDIKEMDLRRVIVNEVGYPEREIGSIHFSTK